MGHTHTRTHMHVGHIGTGRSRWFEAPRIAVAWQANLFWRRYLGQFGLPGLVCPVSSTQQRDITVCSSR